MPDMDELHVTARVDASEFHAAVEDAKRALERVRYERQALARRTNVEVSP